MDFGAVARGRHLPDGLDAGPLEIPSQVATVGDPEKGPLEEFAGFGGGHEERPHRQEHGGAGDFVILTDKALDLGYERNCLEQETGR